MSVREGVRSYVFMCMCAYTHIFTLTRTHTHTRTHTQTLTHIHTHSHTQTHTHSPTHTIKEAIKREVESTNRGGRPVTAKTDNPKLVLPELIFR